MRPCGSKTDFLLCTHLPMKGLNAEVSRVSKASKVFYVMYKPSNVTVKRVFVIVGSIIDVEAEHLNAELIIYFDYP